MLTKQHKFLQRQYIKGGLNVKKAAQHLGYKGNALSKGMNRVRTMLSDMRIPGYTH